MTYSTPAFRYSPGDGHIYVWDSGPWIEVWDVVHSNDEQGQPQRCYHKSTLVIACPKTDGRPTSQQLAVAVDRWREAMAPPRERTWPKGA